MYIVPFMRSASNNDVTLKYEGSFKGKLGCGFLFAFHSNWPCAVKFCNACPGIVYKLRYNRIGSKAPVLATAGRESETHTHRPRVGSTRPGVTNIRASILEKKNIFNNNKLSFSGSHCVENGDCQR